MKCIECGLPMVVAREEYEYGAAKDFVVHLLDVETGRDENGHVARSLPHVGPLNRVIAAAIVGKAGRMTGPEFRFLRGHLGYQAKDFAPILGATASGVSRWETGDEPIGPQTDRLLRLLVVVRDGINPFDPAALAAIGKEKGTTIALRLEFVGDAWTPALKKARRRSTRA